MASSLPTSTYPIATAMLSEGSCPLCTGRLEPRHEANMASGDCNVCRALWRVEGAQVWVERDLTLDELGWLLDREHPLA